MTKSGGEFKRSIFEKHYCLFLSTNQFFLSAFLSFEYVASYGYSRVILLEGSRLFSGRLDRHVCQIHCLLQENYLLSFPVHTHEKQTTSVPYIHTFHQIQTRPSRLQQSSIVFCLVSAKKLWLWPCGYEREWRDNHLKFPILHVALPGNFRERAKQSFSLLFLDNINDKPK